MEVLAPDRLKILLGGEDLTKFDISFNELDYSKAQTKRVVWQLLDKARKETGFDATNGRLMIEALPALDGGCVLYVTLLAKNDLLTPKRICMKRIKSSPYVLEFEDAQAMLSAAVRLYCYCKPDIEKSALYNLKGRYMMLIIPKPDDSTDIKNILREYGTISREGEGAMAYLNEHAKVIVKTRAIDKIAKAMTTA